MLLFKNKRETVFALVYGFIFSFINLYTFKGQDWKNLNLMIFLQILGLSILLSFIIGEIYLVIKKLLNKRNLFISSDSGAKKSRYYFFVTLIHIISYLIVFLAYYPGIFAYDVHHQLAVYSTKHPLLHTLFIRFFYNVVGGKIFHDYNIGIAFASVTQIILFSLMISLLHYVIYKKDLNRIFRYILIGFSCLCPIYSVLVISHTKDIFFTGFFIMFISMVFSRAYSVKISHSNVFLVISIIGLCMFRNNCLYAFVLVVLYYVGKKVIFRKVIDKQFVLLILGSIVLSVILSFGLKTILKAESVSKNQFLSIPYQQIANVYHKEYDKLDEDTIKFCKYILQDIDLYNIHIADDLKSSGRALANPVKFVATYINLLIRYPLDYINAFLQTNSGFLYVFDESTGYLYTDDPSMRMGYLATFYWKGYGVETQSKLPFLFNLYEYLFTYNNYLNIYIIRPIFEYANYIWIILIIGMYFIQDRNGKFETATIFVLVYMLSVFMGPCALVRYAFPFIAICPLFITAYI